MKTLRPAEINFNGDAWSATHRLQWRRMVIYILFYTFITLLNGRYLFSTLLRSTDSFTAISSNFTTR